ncbi:hypothetical protein EEB13_03520 [Rhodococcus sp. WS3]|nr:hypothetical protein EEB13_03520 [Rhodococcus sp. WS3]
MLHYHLVLIDVRLAVSVVPSLQIKPYRPLQFGQLQTAASTRAYSRARYVRTVIDGGRWDRVNRKLKRCG